MSRDHPQGEFHCHTAWSDSSTSVAGIAKAASERGYTCRGIPDESQGLGVTHGLTPGRLAAQRREIEATNRGGATRLFAGAEVEVARDGRLDLRDETLVGWM